MKARRLSFILPLLCLCVSSSAQDLPLSDCTDDGLLCGPRSLLAVCRRLEVKADLEELKRLSGYQQETGVSMAGLKKAALAKGLHAIGAKISIEELLSLNIPAIVHLWGNHFVMVERSAPDTLTVVGSSGEPLTVKVDDLRTEYSGFSLLVSDRLFTVPTDFRGPDLRLGMYAWEFGAANEGERPACTIGLTNAGTADLVILNVDSSCPCMTTVVSENVIPPGGKGEVRVIYDTRDQQLRQSRELYIRSNDPVSPTVVVGVSGYIRSRRLLISSRDLDFGEVRRSANEAREVYIRSIPEDEVKVISVACDSPHLKTEVYPSKRPELPGYMVTVSVRPDAPLGKLTGKLTVESTHTHEPKAEITASADVRGDILVVPDSMFFGVAKAGQERRAAIRVSSVDERPCMIERADCSLPFVSVEVRSNGREYVVTGTLKGDASPGNIKGDITLHTNQPDQRQLKVPVYALVGP